MKTIWTGDMINQLMDLYPSSTTESVANKMNLSVCSVYSKAFSLGLHKSNEYLNSPDAGRLQKGDLRGLKSRFTNGHTPANKGKKMADDVYEKVSRTMFKKGSIPATTKYFGKPYLHTRMRDNGQVERTWYIQVNQQRLTYLTYLCKQHSIDMTGKKPRLKNEYDFSKVPTMNDINIISNAENLELNTVQRFPEELRNLIQIKGALNRQLNKLKVNE